MSSETKAAPPFEIILPEEKPAPAVFASPHSGRHYPTSFRSASRLDPQVLRKSEDYYVDELFASAPLLGAPLIKALYPRAYLDLNREAYELDPAMFRESLPVKVNAGSERVAAGLGTIARIVAAGFEIYKSKLSFAEAENRIQDIYYPYHEALYKMLQKAREHYGWAVLIDCHSMPSGGDPPGRLGTKKNPDFVLGDRNGRSCASLLIDRAEAALKNLGYRVSRNDPYAGGYCAERYGKPQSGFHALQIEVNRGLYVDEATLEKKPHFNALARDLEQMIAAVIDIDLPRRLQQAAE